MFLDSEKMNINAVVSDNWDKNVIIRAQDLETGSDLTYKSVIVPWILNKIENLCSKNTTILDIGCGCGFLTNLIYSVGLKRIDGIDLSNKSVEYAKKKYPYINFINEDFCGFKSDVNYDLAIATMTLNNVSNIESFFYTSNRLLKQAAKVLIIIPHPCFWPTKHLGENFISYLNEKSYEIKFSTKGRSDYPSNVLYFHRPLEKYFEYAKQNGFKVILVDELREDDTESVPDIMGIILEKE